MGNPDLKAPLRRPAFRRLAASYAINEVADWLSIVALSVLVYDLTGDALATAALFLGTGFLPAFLTPFFVVRSERPPPRYALPAIYAGEAVAFAALALLADNFSLPLVVAVATLDGTLALTARTLTRGVTASMLEPHNELRAGNAVLNVAFSAGAAGGPVLAGAVVATLGAQSTLLAAALLLYATAWIVFTAGRLPHTEAEPGRIRDQVSAGFEHIRGNLTLRRLIGAEAVLLVFFSLVVPIEVIYAKESLGAGDTGYGLLLGSWGAGMVLGSVVFAALRQTSLPVLLFFSTVAIGVSYTGMAGAQTLVVACAASVVGGVGNGVQWVAMISAVQELTSRTMQVRTIGTLESIATAAPGLGFVLGGLIASIWDPRVAFLVAGLSVLVVVLAAAPLLGRHWERAPDAESREEAAADEVMVELIPRV